MSTTAFVAGATGFTGREVVRILAQRGLSVVAHLRPDSSQAEAWIARWQALGVTVDRTPWEPDAIAATLRDRAPELVFAVLGTTRARAAKEAKEGVPRAANSYERVDYGMTKMLIDGLVAAGSDARFVYLSSVGVRAGGNDYMDARWRIEELLRKGPLPYTIARPSFIVGDRDEARPLETVGSAVTDAALGLAGLLGANRLRARYASTSAAQLAGALVHHGLDPASAGRIVEAEELRGY